jgi:hypothetical protein
MWLKVYGRKTIKMEIDFSDARITDDFVADFCFTVFRSEFIFVSITVYIGYLFWSRKIRVFT